MPETPPGDSRKLIFVIVAAALIVSWVAVGTVVGYNHMPAPFIGAMIGFDLAIFYFIWRILGPRGRG